MGAVGRVQPARGGRPHAGPGHVRPLSRPADALVVGAGAVGLSAALALRDRGARVRVLEAAAPGAGQSAGPGRIFRHMHELPALIDLAVRARRGWREAEERFGRRLLGAEGTLLLGPVEEHRRRLEQAGVAHAVVRDRGLAEVMPALATSHGEGLLDLGGGMIDAEAYVAVVAGEVGDGVVRGTARGARVAGRRAVVATDEGEVAAGAVLVCAGAGTPALARGLGIDLPVASGTHRRISFRAPGGSSLPCLLERSGRHGMTGYGTPLPEGGYALGTAAADDLTEESAVELTAGYLARVLPGLSPRPAGVVRCATTVLAGHTEALGLFGGEPAWVFAGGNLFKHVPALGPLLADAVLEGRVDPVLAAPAGVEASAGA